MWLKCIAVCTVVLLRIYVCVCTQALHTLRTYFMPYSAKHRHKQRSDAETKNMAVYTHNPQTAHSQLYNQIILCVHVYQLCVLYHVQFSTPMHMWITAYCCCKPLWHLIYNPLSFDSTIKLCLSCSGASPALSYAHACITSILVDAHMRWGWLQDVLH